MSSQSKKEPPYLTLNNVVPSLRALRAHMQLPNMCGLFAPCACLSVDFELFLPRRPSMLTANNQKPLEVGELHVHRGSRAFPRDMSKCQNGRGKKWWRFQTQGCFGCNLCLPRRRKRHQHVTSECNVPFKRATHKQQSIDPPHVHILPIPV